MHPAISATPEVEDPEHGWGGHVAGPQQQRIRCTCGEQFADIDTYVDHLIAIGRKGN